MATTSQLENSGGIYDCPLAIDPHSLQPRGFEPKDVLLRYKRYVPDSRHYVVGPMPVQEFLDEFLPPSSAEDRSNMRAPTKAFRAVPSRATVPAEIYEPLVRNVQSSNSLQAGRSPIIALQIKALSNKTTHKSRAPGLVFRHPHHHSGTSPSSQFSPPTPHICCYATNNDRVIRKAEAHSRLPLGYTEFFIDVRPDPIHDTFVDPPSGQDTSHEFMAALEPELKPLVTRAFAKHIFHVSEILARQYRTFLFTISMCGSRARLFRWDRSGAIVTHSFDIRDEPEIFCEFLWRFSCASRLARGHDLTVELASSPEENLFRQAVQRYIRDQLGLEGEELNKAVSEHYQPGRVIAVDVFAQDPDHSAISIHRYLVSRPVVSPMSPIGRGTRAYWAVRSGSDRVVFLKDTWRYDHEPEGNTLATLNESGVSYVPKLILHGDVFHPPSILDEKPTGPSSRLCYEPS